MPLRTCPGVNPLRAPAPENDSYRCFPIEDDTEPAGQDHLSMSASSEDNVASLDNLEEVTVTYAQQAGGHPEGFPIKRFSGWLAVLMIVSGLVSACAAPKAAAAPTPPPAPQSAPAPAPQLSEWDKVLAAARKEGTVTVYSTAAAVFKEAMGVGMSQYGVKVETVGGSGGELEQRISTEQRAKANSADLFTGGWTNQLNILQAGYGQTVNVALPALGQKGVWVVDPGKYDRTNSIYAYAITITPSVIVNTDLVQKSEIQSWQDLLAPKWKDKIVMVDPRTGSGPAAGALGAWLPILGEDFWRKMATQRIVMYMRNDQPISAVSYGEKPLSILTPTVNVVSAIKAGAPVQIVHLKEGTTYAILSVMFIKNAPHPNAALLLLNWMLTKDGQAALGRAAQYNTVRSDITEDWISIREMRRGAYTQIEPPNNMDPAATKKASEFAKSIFGTP